jgi:Tuberculosis necrotizing toxin
MKAGPGRAGEYAAGGSTQGSAPRGGAAAAASQAAERVTEQNGTDTPIFQPGRTRIEAPSTPAKTGEPASQQASHDANGETADVTAADVTAASAGAFQQSPSQWKIQPLPGEPPLTLYRDKRVVLLPAGTEVDRYGEDAGNVTYAVGTEYGNRSLPPDWSSFQYHAYRLKRPLEVLTGLAVPWFEQPGGGTAFVLPRSVAELAADGLLVEIEGATAPKPS